MEKYTRFRTLSRAVVTDKVAGKFETAVFDTTKSGRPLMARSEVITSTTFAQAEAAHDAEVDRLKSEITS